MTEKSKIDMDDFELVPGVGKKGNFYCLKIDKDKEVFTYSGMEGIETFAKVLDKL